MCIEKYKKGVVLSSTRRENKKGEVWYSTFVSDHADAVMTKNWRLKISEPLPKMKKAKKVVKNVGKKLPKTCVKKASDG